LNINHFAGDCLHGLSVNELGKELDFHQDEKMQRVFFLRRHQLATLFLDRIKIRQGTKGQRGRQRGREKIFHFVGNRSKKRVQLSL